MKFTSQQQDAIFTDDKNLVVVAGAGSGKTRVLVERYVHLLDNNPDWELNALVAITFTKEAALEMRNRVRQQLEERFQQAAPDERGRWSRLLSQMDSARIGTIHSLCATILRANAAAAGVDPGFEVLEPVDAGVLLDDALDRVLQDLADNDANTAALFTEYDMRQVRDVLTSGLLAAALDEMPTNADDLLQMWHDEWQADFDAALRAFIAEPVVQRVVRWSSLPAGDKLSAVFDAVQLLLGKLDDDGSVSDRQTTLESIDGAINLRGGSQKNWGSKENLKEAKAALKEVRERVQTLLEDYQLPDEVLEKRAAEMLLRWYTLVENVREEYALAKRRERALDFNDLEARTAALLRDYPAVRERYCGKEYRALLVDEFQDTNDAQWQIVQALADFDAAALFVVGDMKQSIYGFRGADVSVFGEVRETLDKHLANGAELPLSRSFRSHPALIDIFNALFDSLMTRNENSPVAEYEIAFTPDTDAMTAHRERLPDAAQQAYAPVELLLVETWWEDGKNISSDERRLLEAKYIAERLHQLHADNAPIHDKETDEYRGFQYGDAAILFQTTTKLTQYEAVFKALALPFVTVGGRGYYNRQEVWDVLNLLKTLHNPADDLALAAALRSPLFGVDDDMLLALRRLRDDSGAVLPLWDALSLEIIPALTEAEHAQIAAAYTTLRDLRKLAGRVRIAELLRQALAQTGYLATLTGLPNGARLRRNVEKLVTIAQESGKITLGSFSHYLADMTAKEVREGEAALDTDNAVKLMTVHASKGLEFPVVILADASWENRGGRGEVLLYDAEHARLACKAYDDTENKLATPYTYEKANRLADLKEAAERLRLLYVAATRARDCLLLAGELRYSSNKGHYSYGWLQEIVTQFGIANSAGEIDDVETLTYADQSVRVHLPDYDDDTITQLQSGESTVQWRELDLRREVATPAGLRPIHAPEDDMLGHISATHLASIGGWYHTPHEREREYFREELRRDVFDDAPAQIREAVRTREPRLRQRHVGEVVHEALRYWRFPDQTDDIDAVLRSYAWQQHITEPELVSQVVRRARTLLEQFQQSDLYTEIQTVKAEGLPFFSEMPFLFRTEKRIIHGVIDVLYQTPAGTWTILDYKTSYVSARPTPEAVADHARRYHLQLGAYAAAVQEQLSTIPHVTLHYIPYNQTVRVPTTTWQAAIQQLEDVIGEVLDDRHTQTPLR